MKKTSIFPNYFSDVAGNSDFIGHSVKCPKWAHAFILQDDYPTIGKRVPRPSPPRTAPQPLPLSEQIFVPATPPLRQGAGPTVIKSLT